MDTILSHLREQAVIDESTEKSIAESYANSPDASLEQLLRDAGVTEESLRTNIASFYGIPPYTPPEELNISQETLSFIPEESARHYRMMPVELEDGVLHVAVNDPEDLQLRQALGFVSSKHDVPYKFVFVLQSDLEELLEAYENLSGEVDEALTSLESELETELAKQQAGGTKAEELAREHIKEDAPVTKIVATVLRYAIDGGASDVHIQPTEARVDVRFRVDGVLHKSLELPRKVQSAVVARVKILASIRLDEKRRPQDGRFSAKFDDRKIDFRVSILPTNHGEKVVMRILDPESGISSLSDTGISEYNLTQLRQSMNVPYGIILISGPTGSGKSTTLYTMLREMDRSTRNVLSLEDPIEYNIEGVSQSQVQPSIGYTFAEGLRSALRQDPDVILVGEIRDKETAQLAIQAALTGHLVLSTIHTNNAIGVIPRLIDMGIDPYLIAPTLRLAVAQRLARRLCNGREIPVNDSMREMITREFESLPEEYRERIPESDTVMEPEAAPGCATGLRGRVAVMEALPIDEEIQSLILENAGEAAIYEVARKKGFMTLREDALIKALEHTIPYKEVHKFGVEVADESAISKEYLASDTPSERPTPAADDDSEHAKIVKETLSEADADTVDNQVAEDKE